MRGNKDLRQRKVKDITAYLSIIVMLALLVIFSSLWSFRIDLTEDKRHTISDATKNILESVDDDVYIQVYLEGDLPEGFKRLKRATAALLDEFRHFSGRNLSWNFINPSESDDEAERNRYYNDLVDKGLNPVKIMAEDKEGAQSEKIIFPGMIINYNGIELPVNFLKNNPTVSAEQNIVSSMEGLEYELIQSISTIASDTVHKIAFIEGQGELDEVEVADATLELAKFFTVDRGTIGGVEGVLDNYSAIVVAGPTNQFSEQDKLVIDQYIMNGGSVLWLVEEVYVDRDSLATGGSMALYRPVNIEDQLFRYGVRINPVLIQDTECQIIPVRTNQGGQAQYLPVPWIYYPLLFTSNYSPVTKNLNRVKGEFTNYIDTVGNDPHVKKMMLLASSQKSRVVSPPKLIGLEEFKDPPPEEVFNQAFLPVAVMLEGEFTSVFKNRVKDYNGGHLKELSVPTRMIVVADADIIRNEVIVKGNNVTPLQLGLDRYSQQVYGNKDFIVNCLNWLVDDKGILGLRSREVKMRLLDRTRISEERMRWQLVNTIIPVLLVLIVAGIYSILRKRKNNKPMVI